MQELGISDIEELAKQKHLDAVRLETSLLRLGKDYIRRGRPLDVRVD